MLVTGPDKTAEDEGGEGNPEGRNHCRMSIISLGANPGFFCAQRSSLETLKESFRCRRPRGVMRSVMPLPSPDLSLKGRGVDQRQLAITYVNVFRSAPGMVLVS